MVSVKQALNYRSDVHYMHMDIPTKVFNNRHLIVMVIVNYYISINQIYIFERFNNEY